MKNKPSFFQTIPGVGAITLILLMIPLIAMQFTPEVNWSVSDFVVMGILLFSTGTAFVLLIRKAGNLVYRVAMGMAIGVTFLMIWVNLAVGLIGSGAHAGNLMYIGVVAVVIAGTILSGFTARGMKLTMFAAALALVLLAVIALLANMQQYPGSSVTEIILVNGFFAVLYTISGMLFNHAMCRQVTA